MKLLIVNNTSSGYGDGAIYDYIRMVSSDGDEHCIRYTDGTTEIATMLDDADRFDAVVAAGGDGTIAAVSYTLANTGIPILPFPAGTGNLLANNRFRLGRNRDHARAPRIRHHGGCRIRCRHHA